MEALSNQGALRQAPNGTKILDADGDHMRRVTGGWILEGVKTDIVFGHIDIVLPAQVTAWGTGVHA